MINHNVRLIKSRAYASSKSWYLTNGLAKLNISMVHLGLKKSNLFDYATFLNKTLSIYQSKIIAVQTNPLKDKNITIKVNRCISNLNVYSLGDINNCKGISTLAQSALGFLRSGSYCYVKEDALDTAIKQNTFKF